MIKQGRVELSSARGDCDIPMTGNMQCEELSDRAGTTVRTASGYTPGQVSFSSLRGSVTSFQCRHAGPTESSGNVTPPADASKGMCHTNLYSPMNPTSMKQGRLDPPNYAFGYGSTGLHKGTYDIMAGLCYVGYVPDSATLECMFSARLGGSGSTTYRNLAIEFIGWTGGFFSGSPQYYKSRQYTTDLVNQQEILTTYSTHPYLTINLQALSRGGATQNQDYADIFIDDIMVKQT